MDLIRIGSVERQVLFLLQRGEQAEHKTFDKRKVNLTLVQYPLQGQRDILKG